MSDSGLTINAGDVLEVAEVLALYNANGWSAAHRPDSLVAALNNSDCVVTARDAGRLVGLGNAISDGHLVVYYPHLLVLPDYQRQGIARRLLEVLMSRYAGFHQQVLMADTDAVAFYKALGWTPAGDTQAMWIYEGDEH